jgi:hypothetical protein
MFQFPRFPPPCLYIQHGVIRYHPDGVAPFGYPRIIAYPRLPEAFRGLVTSFFGSRCQGIHRVLFTRIRLLLPVPTEPAQHKRTLLHLLLSTHTNTHQLWIRITQILLSLIQFPELRSTSIMRFRYTCCRPEDFLPQTTSNRSHRCVCLVALALRVSASVSLVKVAQQKRAPSPFMCRRWQHAISPCQLKCSSYALRNPAIRL